MKENEKQCFFCEKAHKVQENAFSFDELTTRRHIGLYVGILCLFRCFLLFFSNFLADFSCSGDGVLVGFRRMYFGGVPNVGFNRIQLKQGVSVEPFANTSKTLPITKFFICIF
ncbi:MAG: hypothetical protein LUD00_12040 [Prevotellaceae bacterium]|nr:hypothetical protein [Prevotellaceae bacterium]